MEQAWIDTNRLKFDDFSENEPGDEWSEEDERFFSELDEREKEEIAYREAMERDQAEMDYTF